MADKSKIEWQPIETAPRDGTSVILAVTGGKNGPVVGEARWWEEWEEHGGDWYWAGNTPGDYHGGPISEINFGTPSHWMPMPEPPMSEIANG
jgi:hypothetical protein